MKYTLALLLVTGCASHDNRWMVGDTPGYVDPATGRPLTFEQRMQLEDTIQRIQGNASAHFAAATQSLQAIDAIGRAPQAIQAPMPVFAPQPMPWAPGPVQRPWIPGQW